MLFKVYMNRVITGISAGVLFPEKPIIHFYPESEDCLICKSKLNIEKTWTKTLVTMEIGAFEAKETVLFCPHDQRVFHSERLRQLAPVGGTFGYDVIVETGRLLFIENLGNQEVMKKLEAKNVFVSEREISYLGRKFIMYLALAHRESQHHLRNLLSRNGGYILHVDGTCEGDSPNLFCGLDGISELVLDTIKIPSEKKELLIPFFEGIKEQYGEPMALVHDMGKGIIAAVEHVFPRSLDFICHFHFLRDIGKDLMLDDYTAFQKRLRKLKVRPSLRQRSKYLESKINNVNQTVEEIMENFESGVCHDNALEHVPLITTYALINWVFEYPEESNGYGFPFDRSYLDFYRRLKRVHRLIEEIKDTNLRAEMKDNKPFLQFCKAFKEIVEDKRLNDLRKSLERKAKVFDKLRTAMRLALPEGKQGLNDNGDEVEISTIQERVTIFKNWLIRDIRREVRYAGMIKQLEKYWNKLFADPLPIVTVNGIQYIQPQRTNNILERFFRGEKQRGRKKSGMASLSKTLKATLAETPLVQNLKNEEYVKTILNGCSSLEERFSKIDTRLVQKELENAKNNTEKISPFIKKLITDSDLTRKISAMFSDDSKNNANCHLRS